MKTKYSLKFLDGPKGVVNYVLGNVVSVDQITISELHRIHEMEDFLARLTGFRVHINEERID